MVDLTTTYMGLKLRNPLVASSSPLSEDVGNIRRMEDMGIAAIVLYSLFEEQITHEVYELEGNMTRGTESFAESLTYFPEPIEFIVGPDEYLDHIRKAKQAVKVPIIGSLNGYSKGGWTKYSKLIQEAGADALELNIYYLATDADVNSTEIEADYIEILKSVKSNVSIPVAVKMHPFFSSTANMARRLDEAGADALVLFNRFYQPDIDLENLTVYPNVLLSMPQAMRLPLRWIAILTGRLRANLAATGGIHLAQDCIKMVMAGADVTMLCSVLLKKGIGEIRNILHEMDEWMQAHDYDSLKQMHGSMSQKSCANPEAFERVNYMKALRSFSD